MKKEKCIFTVKLAEEAIDQDSYADYLESFRAAGKTLSANPGSVVLVVSDEEAHPVIIMYENTVYLANAGHVPVRGSEVETWIKAHRDTFLPHGVMTGKAWAAIDDLLEDYRLHADTGTRLNEEVNEHE